MISDYSDEMCILFIYSAKLSSSSSEQTPSLKFVLASNRDENYSRPTKQAGFWESDPEILAGQDCEAGGTWLGMTKTGKVAALLNIMSKIPDKTKKSRGDLITGFLRSPPTLRGWTYCNNLDKDLDMDARKNYRLFNLITIDLLQASELGEPSSIKKKAESSEQQKPLDITYYTNAEDTGPRHLGGEEDSQVFAFGNSVYDKPFCKVSDGCKPFNTILKSFEQKSLTESVKTDLKEQILGFLKSQEKHFPDPQMQNQAKEANVPVQILPDLAQIFVKSVSTNYGTRTHSLIIIDSENRVDFHEWTLQEPIEIENPQWVESKYEFTLSL